MHLLFRRLNASVISLPAALQSVDTNVVFKTWIRLKISNIKNYFDAIEYIGGKEFERKNAKLITSEFDRIKYLLW